MTTSSAFAKADSEARAYDAISVYQKNPVLALAKEVILFMKKAALVVMAAGMAARYGGNKQIDGMGPHGEILMEYSIYDALRAGFTKVIFVIRPEMLDRMKQICGDRVAQRAEVCYAFQEFSSLPEWFTVPEGRVKPFGTVHAVLCAQQFIDEPFAVINADDYYGVDAFRAIYQAITSLESAEHAAMAGYRLKNTVSQNGTVTRGLCRCEDGHLASVREVRKIALQEDGKIFNTSVEPAEQLNPDELVSMNFWGFHPGIFVPLQQCFEQFLQTNGENLTSECLLPEMVDAFIQQGKLSVAVLETDAIWFGVTYKEDRPIVVKALQDLHDEGIYQEKLL